MDKEERRAGTRSRYPSLTLLALSALVLILAATGWTLIREPPPLQVCRLPDGTLLRLEAITRGPEHRFVLGRYGMRLLASVLPGTPGHFGTTLCAYGPTDPATLVFWTTWDTNSRLTNWTRTVALDESGEEVEDTAQPFQSWLQSRANAKIRGWVVPALPRRGSTIRLRIWVHGQRSPVAEFRAPNPDPPPHSTWAATLLPATQREGDLEWTLNRLETGRVAPASVPSPFRDRHWTRALFRIRERGQPTDRWEPVSVSLSDATGNRIVPWPIFRDRQRGETRFAFCGNLPPSETAWKLRAEFAPARRFAPADLWTVRRIPFPGSEGQSRFTAQNPGRGVGLQLTLSQEGGGPGFIYLRLKQQAACREGDRVALVRAIDDRGRENRIDGWPNPDFRLTSNDDAGRRLEIVRPIARTVENPSWRQGGVYLLACPDGAKTLDLTFAVVKSRFVEFIAKPSRR
jgi:hypothetical protein